MPRDIQQNRYLTTRHGKEIHKKRIAVVDPVDSTKLISLFEYITDGKEFRTLESANKYLDDRYGERRP